MTAYVINKRKNPANSAEAIMFQVEIKAYAEDGSAAFIAEHICREILASDEFYFEQRPIMGRGRGCAAVWDTPVDGRTTYVKSAFIPEYEFPGVSAALDGFDRYFFSTFTMSVKSKKEETIGKLNTLAESYEKWINSTLLGNARMSNPDFKDKIGNKVIERCLDALKRIREGISIIENDDISFEAFCFMNRVIFLQNSIKGYAKKHGTGTECNFQDFINPKNPDNNFGWRPFQIAFILMNLAGIVDPKHKDREVVTGYSLSSYFSELVDTIVLKSQQGVFVKFFVNDIDKQQGFDKILRYKGRFLKIYNYHQDDDKMAALHAKVISVDQQQTLITSANLSYHGQVQEVRLMEYVLKTNALCKNYKNFKALNGLTMNVPKGAIYGFVGKNGAGKTTLIRLICGLQKPESGNYVLYGLKNSEKGILKARRRMGAVVETPSIYLELTAVDNLKEQYRILGIPSYDSIPDLLKLVGLENTGKKKAKNFSLGMKQRLGIAVALAGDPDFLVLDEPVNGLDPQGIIEMRELILKLNREYQITVLISSHILDELSRLATHYGFIDNGRMVKEISAEELEESCRKCVRIEVTNVKALVRVLDEMKTDYNIISDNVADIFAKINISKLTLALSKENCEVISMQERDESLESYYVGLVGGKDNE